MSTFSPGLGNLICSRNNFPLFLTFSHQLVAFFCSRHFHHFLFSPFSPEPICRRKTQKEISQSFLLPPETPPAAAMTTSKECFVHNLLVTNVVKLDPSAGRAHGKLTRVEYDRRGNGGPTGKPTSRDVPAEKRTPS